MSAIVDAWNRFWFEPTPTSTLAVFRIAIGFLIFGWTISLAPDLFAFFSRSGILMEHPHGAFGYGLLRVWPSNAGVLVLYFLLLIASVCLTVGFRTRAAAVVVWVALVSFERRDPWVVNSGDLLLRHLAFYLMLAPAGAALSVDRWRATRDRFWEFPRRAPWALRLVQLQLCLLYLVTVWDKVRGTTWNDGTAVSYALRLADLTRLPVPSAVSTSLVLSNVFTYGTLLIELGLVFLVWNRRARPWILALGITMHLAIEATILIGFFSLAIITAYIVWVPPDTMSERVLRARDRWPVLRALQPAH
jgi:hypothetical protein